MSSLKKPRQPLGLREWVENGTTMVAFLGACGIFAIAGVILLDVLMRWIWNAPIMGVDDVTIYVLAVAVSSFFPLGLAKGHFVTVRLVGKALGDRFARWFEVFGAACSLGFFILVSWRLFLYSIDVTQSGLATVVLQFRQAPWWWTVTAIMVACIPVQAYILVNRFIQARGGGPQVPSSDAPSENQSLLGT